MYINTCSREVEVDGDFSFLNDVAHSQRPDETYAQFADYSGNANAEHKQDRRGEF